MLTHSATAGAWVKLILLCVVVNPTVVNCGQPNCGLHCHPPQATETEGDGEPLSPEEQALGGSQLTDILKKAVTPGGAGPYHCFDVGLCVQCVCNKGVLSRPTAPVTTVSILAAWLAVYVYIRVAS